MEDALEDLKKLSEALGKIPNKREAGLLYYRARRQYGTWNNALYACFGKINKEYKTDKQEAVTALLEFYKQNGRMPKSGDSSKLTCEVQSVFGSWNAGLLDVFGELNQIRNDLTTVHTEVRDFVAKYRRLPLREEFDGVSRPHFSTILRSLKCKKWSDVFAKIDLSGVVYYCDTKHGTGKVYVEDGIVYLSRQEFLIGSWLKKSGIAFEKEVPYENCSYIFDFYLPEYDVYIEYYGLSTEQYKERIEKKRSFYNGRTVIEIMKEDNTLKKLSQEVQRL